jgi:tetratricopeptide (TPR) repeat protein
VKAIWFILRLPVDDAKMSKRFQKQPVRRPVPGTASAGSKVKTELQNAVLLHQRGQLVEAEQIYRNVLRTAPHNFDATHLLGVVFLQRGQLSEGEQLIARALKINPKDPSAHNNRGNALRGLERNEDALASFDKAIAFKPDYVEAFYNRGVVLQELTRAEEALASYDRALALRPDHVEALSNRGNTLHKLKRYDEALASLDKAIALKPDYAEAFYNRGVVFQELMRAEEALASYDKAIALRPNYVEALYNRGAALQELTRFEEVLASYGKAIDLRPDFAEARFNRSLVLLLTGNYADGWDEYEWRLKGGTKDMKPRRFASPQWRGEDLAGKKVLLYAEQGYGDTIQLCRYVPLVAARGGCVILEVQEPLHELMTSLAGTAQIVSGGDPLPHFDVHCPLLSLPLAFRTRLESIPSATPYLRAPSHALQRWKTRLGPRDQLRIGICWAGSLSFKGDASRSIGLSPMLPLLARGDVQFFSLQKDLRAGDAEILRNNPHITLLGQEIETFSDTAAIISSMDLVISSDTSVVHLAGALGKSIWILLQLVPDWRWLLGSEDNPWYPAARLFRQDATRSWDGVIERVQTALAAVLTDNPDSKEL